MTTAITYNNINVGDAMPIFTSDPVTRTHIVRYAGASGDFNFLHHSNLHQDIRDAVGDFPRDAHYGDHRPSHNGMDR